MTVERGGSAGRCFLLDKPYDEDGNSLFQDINLREEVWMRMPDWFEPHNWKETVLAAAEQARRNVDAHYGDRPSAINCLQ
jgi:ATP-dependent helicase HepA